MSDAQIDNYIAGIKEFIQLVDNDYINVNESPAVCSYVKICDDINSYKSISSFLSKYCQIINTTVSGMFFQYSYQFQIGQNDKVLSFQINKDDSITIYNSSSNVEESSVGIERLSSLSNQEFDNQLFMDLISTIQKEQGTTSIKLNININKQNLKSIMEIDETICAVTFIFYEKLIEFLTKYDFQNFTSIFPSSTSNFFALLIGNICGEASSKLLHIFGIDRWQDYSQIKYGLDNGFAQKLDAINSFRKDECFWEIAPINASPFIFFIERKSLTIDELLSYLNLLSVQSCIAFLGNRLFCDHQAKLKSEFYSDRKFSVTIPTTFENLTYDHARNLFSLFHWAYVDSSSDKLSIAREIIAKDFTDDSDQNFWTLCERSSGFEKTAKYNYQFLLKKNVKEYFGIRSNAMDLVKNLGETTNDAILKLTSDLINDLFKTIGIVLSAVLAILLAKEKYLLIIHWSLILYTFYIGVVFFITVIFDYFRFGITFKNRNASINYYKKILTKEEFESIVGIVPLIHRILFNFFFLLSKSMYAVLTALSIYILINFFH